MDTRQMRLIAAGEAPLAASELYAAATAIDALRRELVRSEDAFEQVKRERTGPPGDWLCDQCGFVCHSRAIDATTGNIGVPRIQQVPECSNGCGLLRPITWGENEKRWSDGQSVLLARAEKAELERGEAQAELVAVEERGVNGASALKEVIEFTDEEFPHVCEIAERGLRALLGEEGGG